MLSYTNNIPFMSMVIIALTFELLYDESNNFGFAFSHDSADQSLLCTPKPS